jgi:phosphatidate phosphatase APP1
MLWRLFFTDAEARVAFPKVPAFYRALHAGPSGQAKNPMLYVSRGPWSIRPVIEQFFQDRDIPDGPVVFLRDWGLSLQHPLPRRSEAHKHALIATMVDVYDPQPFVLIGDSGQHDPEVYVDIAEAWPGRVRAIYIRDVTGTRARAEAIAALGPRAEREGARLILAPDVEPMARDAALQGFIPQSAVESLAS